ncbi:hypothetical protein L0156_03810 [bacterium]|nr:hypothetical protein [bacterium]
MGTEPVIEAWKQGLLSIRRLRDAGLLPETTPDPSDSTEEELRLDKLFADGTITIDALLQKGSEFHGSFDRPG